MREKSVEEYIEDLNTALNFLEDLELKQKQTKYKIRYLTNKIREKQNIPQKNLIKKSKKKQR